MTFDYKIKLNQLKLNKYYFIWVGAGVALLLILAWILNNQVNILKGKNLKNTATLNQALPGFTSNSLEKFQQEVKNLKIQIVKLSSIFDPKEKWFKEGYDMTIQFVEELGKANQTLKAKAIDKQINYPELGFKEKLPSESEAYYLLSQLYDLKEVVSLGMDYNINFKNISPLGVEELPELSGIKMAKTSIELSCPAQNLIEFIIQLNEIVPKPYIESLLLKSQESSFEMNLTLSSIVLDVDMDWKDKQQVYSLKIKEPLPETEQNSIRILRSNNPFLITLPKEIPKPQESEALSKADKSSEGPRFLYQGKATLKAKEVIVIEDTLKQETVFLGQGEKIDNFILKEFSDDEAVLRNINDDKVTIIKRGRK